MSVIVMDIKSDNSSILSSNCTREEDEFEDDNWIWEGFIGESISTGDIDFPKLKTIDVAQLLQVKAVYVSGGLDKTGSPLIIFPPSSDFGNINDTDIEKIFHYLVQRFGPEERKKGFTAIIDRRSDKWSSVKFVLTRLQTFFTATVQHAYVLKPQGFFQKYSESGFKSNLETYSFKVVILNDVVNLYEYVDKTQLTKCLGGTLNYAHDEWVQHRTAIDRFGETCRSIASRLVTLKQIFDKTDLTSSGTVETQHVLDVHGQMWFDVRDDINNAHLTGNTQLKCIEDDCKNTENSPLQLLQSSVQDLQSLVEKLEVVRDKFERIWEKHQNRVLQSIQFSFFEREFNEIKDLFSSLHSKLSGMTEVGDSEAAAKKLKNDAEQFQLEAEGPLAKLVDLQERGDEMIKNTNYCSNLIQTKCFEMQNFKGELNEKINERKNNLDKSVEVHQCLHQVNMWCQTGVDILASQPLDRFQSAEGAEKALKEIDEFLKKPQGVNLGKINRMEKTGKELKDEHLLEQVRMALKRISEVTEMMSNREASFKKMVTKRPVQPVAPVSPQTPSTDSHKKKREGVTPLSGLHFKKDNKHTKTPSPKPPRRPISIVITPESVSPKLSISSPSLPGERTRSTSSTSSPRNSNNIDIEDDTAVLKKRAQVMNELVETERVYVYDLKCVVDGYMKEYQDGSPKLPRELRGKKSIIFGNTNEIYLFHRDVFLRELELCMDQPLLVGEVFIAKENEFQMYASYCKNKPSSEALRKECADVPFFQECQKQLGHQLPLHAYLLKPIQRITKYQLILKEMIKYSQKSPDCSESLRKALEGMMKVLRNLNDVMHSTYIRGFSGNLSDQGKLLMQDSFVVWQSSKKTRINMNISQFKGRPRQVFLYEKLVVLTKREDETHRDCVYYQCKNVLKMIDIGLTETAKGDPLKFGLWVQNKSEFYTLQAVSQDVKDCWVQEIRRLLQSQFSLVKASRKLSTEISSERRTSQEPVTLVGTQGIENNNAKQYEEVIDNVYEDEDDDWSDDSDWSDDDDDDEEEEGTTTSTEEESKVLYSAIADYTAFEASELSFVQGDLVQVLRIGDGGWWFARLQKTLKEGWVPGSYLEIYQQDVICT